MPLHWSQISPGQLLKVNIMSVNDFGLVVRINDKIQGICPVLHLSDAGHILTLVQMKKKFKIGQLMKVRVWETKKSAILVTYKKSIVDYIYSDEVVEEKGTEVGNKDEDNEEGDVEGSVTSIVKRKTPLPFLVSFEAAFEGQRAVGVIGTSSEEGEGHTEDKTCRLCC